MVYHPEQFRWREERDYAEYQKDPAAYVKRADAHARATWIAFMLLYVPLLAWLIVRAVPPARDIEIMFKQPRFQLIAPLAVASIGVSLYILKARLLMMYAATELAFALASAILATHRLASEGFGAAIVVVGAIYLFVRGTENLVNGMRARREVDHAKAKGA